MSASRSPQELASLQERDASHRRWKAGGSLFRGSLLRKRAAEAREGSPNGRSKASVTRAAERESANRVPPTEEDG